jgi:O-acetyl-ADP-ribose deacetylase (regulator of RNase III)
MSGGLDLVIAAAFPGLEDAVQKSAPIEVGDTRIFSVQHPVIHAVVYAPTMAIAKDVSTSKNAFLAMYGVLCAAGVCEQDISIPGLCTGVGKMPPIVAAVQMRAAYLEWQHARS